MAVRMCVQSCPAGDAQGETLGEWTTAMRSVEMGMITGTMTVMMATSLEEMGATPPAE